MYTLTYTHIPTHKHFKWLDSHFSNGFEHSDSGGHVLLSLPSRSGVKKSQMGSIFTPFYYNHSNHSVSSFPHLCPLPRLWEVEEQRVSAGQLPHPFRILVHLQDFPRSLRNSSKGEQMLRTIHTPVWACLGMSQKYLGSNTTWIPTFGKLGV